MTTITAGAAVEGSSPDFFTEDEIIVAEILSNLRYAYTRPAALRWPRKRKRSAIPTRPRILSSNSKTHVKFKHPGSPTLTPPPPRILSSNSKTHVKFKHPSPPTLTPPLPRILSSNSKTHVKFKPPSPPTPTPPPPLILSSNSKTYVKFKLPSPPTPSLLAPSNSNTIDAIAISKPIKRQETKRKFVQSNKEMKDLINELLREQEKLKSQIVEMRKFDERLIPLNLQLKSYESQLAQCKNIDQLEIPRRNIDLNICEGPATDLGFVTFDLNNKAAVAAQARKRRIERMRVKRVLRVQNHV